MSPSEQQLPRIDRAGLCNVMATATPVVLVHATGAADFRQLHIRDALALADAAQARRALRRDDNIVVYGKDATCAISRALARDLLDHGYEQVRWYAGGLQEWVQDGGEVEGVDADDSTAQVPRQSLRPGCGQTD